VSEDNAIQYEPLELPTCNECYFYNENENDHCYLWATWEGYGICPEYRKGSMPKN